MKKCAVCLMVISLVFIFSQSSSYANTVTINFENMYSSGIYVASFQMNFLEDSSFGHPDLDNIGFTNGADNNPQPLQPGISHFLMKNLIAIRSRVTQLVFLVVMLMIHLNLWS